MEQTASEPDNHAGNKDFDVSLVPIGYGAPFDTEIPLQRFDTDASAAFSYFSRTEGKDDSNNMKARVYLTLTHPRSSRSARYAHMFLGCISICSIVLMGVQTMPEFINATVDLRIWNIVQAVLSSILLVEWTVRFFCFPEPRKLDFFKRTLNVTDLIGSLSIVVELGVLFTSSVHSGFEVIGLLRLFRLVRLAEMSGQVRSLTRALSKSRDAFVLMVAVYFIGVWFWASVIYYTERPFCRVDDKTGGLVYIWGNNEGTPCSFQSIIDATWWAVVMMSTVGFGDVVPKTWAGKLVAGFGIIVSC
ncbi:hypothetical protein BJ742DRAFT_366769 [Cladochytrium replicatum]|nr:hypothetical protein BJ742DRAFT_366769 [Cladochytrium replicatum]